MLAAAPLLLALSACGGGPAVDAANDAASDSSIDAAQDVTVSPMSDGALPDAAADAASVDVPVPVDVQRTPVGRDARYCELLLAFPRAGTIRVEVWGTQGLNDCPMAPWLAIDTAAVRASTGAAVVLRNGPRYWLPDRTTGTIPERAPAYFGALLFQQLASIEVPAGTMLGGAYVERTILRNARFEIDAGREVYELLAPDGSIYVMQAWAQIADPTLSARDLPGLGARLALPMGWRFRARTLDAPLIVETPGMAVVVQDDLQNSYSRHVDGSP